VDLLAKLDDMRDPVALVLGATQPLGEVERLGFALEQEDERAT